MSLRPAFVAFVCGLMLSSLSTDASAARGVRNPAFERIVDDALADASQAEAAFAVLRAIAENQAETITDESAAQFGLESAELRSSLYKVDAVRAEAYRAIGRLGTPDAIEYLENFKGEDFSRDEFFELWPAAQEALYEWRLAQIPTWPDKALFLEETIRQYTHVQGNGYLPHWAAEKLCDNGILTSYPAVSKWLHHLHNEERAREESGYCEARMRIIASNPDRTTAIESFLHVTDRDIDRRLMIWAIGEMTAIGSPRAVDALKKFELEILALPDDSPQQLRLMGYANAINMIHHTERPLRKDGTPYPITIE